MKNKRTAKVLLATMGLTVAMPAMSAFAATDISGHWCENVITRWETKGLISGYEDGTFRPDQAITRAEFVSLANRYLGYKDAAVISFSDVAASDWYAGQVAIAVNKGYAGGFDDNTFRPGENLTRAQTASIVARLTGLAGNAAASESFADAAQNPDWAKGAIGAVAEAGYMIGDENNCFNPNKALTRAEAVAILDRLSFLLDVKPAKPGISGGAIGGGGGFGSSDIVIDFEEGNITEETVVDGNPVVSTETETTYGGFAIETTVFDAAAVDAITTVKEIPEGMEIKKVTLPAGSVFEAGRYTITLTQDIEKTGEYTFTIADILAVIDSNSEAYRALSDLAELRGETSPLITCTQMASDKLIWNIEVMTPEQQVAVFKQLVVTLGKTN